MILTTLAWRELALRFLDSCNPQPDKAIVIADCIVSYRGPFPEDQPLRHHAHEFFREAEAQIQHGNAPTDSPIGRWIADWNKHYGV